MKQLYAFFFFCQYKCFTFVLGFFFFYLFIIIIQFKDEIFVCVCVCVLYIYNNLQSPTIIRVIVLVDMNICLYN